MLSIEYNGGYEVCVYFDVFDKKYEQFKGYCFEFFKFFLLKWVWEFYMVILEIFNQWEGKFV